jgi:hypothetical protein
MHDLRASDAAVQHPLVYDAPELRRISPREDGLPHDVEPREVDADAECGRGLTVVAALSTRWGSNRTSYQHKVVWAELDLSASVAGGS